MGADLTVEEEVVYCWQFQRRLADLVGGGGAEQPQPWARSILEHDVIAPTKLGLGNAYIVRDIPLEGS